jgi:hypothetical protein
MIEFKTNFGPEILKSLQKFQMRKMKWLFIAFSIFFIAMGLLSIFDAVEPDIGSGIFLICFGTFYMPVIGLITFPIAKRQNKTMKILDQETTNYFRFDEFKVYQEMVKYEDYKATIESSYPILHRVCETKTHFFMYISNMQAHVIPKKDIISGTVEELSEIFARSLGKKKFKQYGIKK